MAYIPIQITDLPEATTVNDDDAFIINTGTLARHVLKTAAFKSLCETLTDNIKSQLTTFTGTKLITNWADGSSADDKPYSAKCVSDKINGIMGSGIIPDDYNLVKWNANTAWNWIADNDPIDKINKLKNSISVFPITLTPARKYTYTSVSDLTCSFDADTYNDQLDSSIEFKSSSKILLHTFYRGCNAYINVRLKKGLCVVLFYESSDATKDEIASNMISYPTTFFSSKNGIVLAANINLTDTRHIDCYQIAAPAKLAICNLDITSFINNADVKFKFTPLPVDTAYQIFEYYAS